MRAKGEDAIDCSDDYWYATHRVLWAKENFPGSKVYLLARLQIRMVIAKKLLMSNMLAAE